MASYAERARGFYLETGTRPPRSLIWAVGMVKYAAARANAKLGLLEPEVGEAIAGVALELAEGRYDDRIIVDVFQTGSGTGLNMNVNEVIAEEASRRLGRRVHPNDHVNMSQSSNDVIPTAVRLAAARESLGVQRAVEELVLALERLASAEASTVKPGRTHLRDALPVTLGQELEAFAEALRLDLRVLEAARGSIVEVPLGGTAVGTGLNAHPDYPRLAVSELARATGLPVREARSRMRPMRLLTDLLALSNAYRMIAVDITRLAQDLRLMNSGPNTGFGEVEVSTPIPGSSMMPGKTNPVTLEAAMQAAAHVFGLDHSMLQASLLGELELSMGLPLAGYTLHREALLVSEAARKIAAKVVPSIEPRRDRMLSLARSSQALVTVFAPLIGYEAAARLSKELSSGTPLEEAAKRLGIPEEVVRTLENLEELTKPGLPALRARRGEGG
ncbi:MAG: fumarate hydratase [Desulfurococcales archaeon]|nr:fumarate hydratase [Desulfurococcales archaeon]